MPQPKILGALNNCPVNVCLPEIIKGIGYFASVQAGEGKAIPAYEAHRAGYEGIKTAFQTFYNLGSITWRQFHRVVTNEVNNNSTAAQLMMGPVLRKAMNSPLQDNGRYQALTLQEVSDELLTDLGIVVREHNYGISGDLMQLGSYGGDQPQPVATVDVFNTLTSADRTATGHWERGVGPLADSKDDREDMSATLRDIHRDLGAGTRAEVGSALNQLKQVVNELAENTSVREVKPVAKIFDSKGFINDLRVADLKYTGPQISIAEVANTKKALEGESDENFAKRLQEAELRKYDEEVKNTPRPRR